MILTNFLEKLILQPEAIVLQEAEVLFCVPLGGDSSTKRRILIWQEVAVMSFSCETSISWSGSKVGVVRSEDKPDFQVSALPELGGRFGVWTPPNLLVAACESDVMLTFISLAARNGIEVVAYSSRAVGELEGEPEALKVVRIDVFPDVEVASNGKLALRLLEQVKETCLVCNIVGDRVKIHPKLRESSARRSVKIIEQSNLLS